MLTKVTDSRKRRALREMLAGPGLVVASGVFDALGARYLRA